MPSSVVLVLIAGALALGAVAVIVDRINFPQRRFVPKQVTVDESDGATRDRTGAHIVDPGDDGSPSDPSSDPSSDRPTRSTD